MGKPVKILKLAKQMINLRGLKLKNKENPYGDIEIVYTGLRHGEKLYEELLIDSKAQKTDHPLIFRAKEKFIPFEILSPKLDELFNFLISENEGKTLDLLSELVPEWERRV